MPRPAPTTGLEVDDAQRASGPHQQQVIADGSPAALRVTVNLSGRATTALQRIHDLTGDSKTEAINKALQAYCLIQEAQGRGGGAWLQDEANATLVQTRFY